MIFNIQLFLIYRVQHKNLTIFNFFFHTQFPAEKPDDFNTQLFSVYSVQQKPYDF